MSAASPSTSAGVSFNARLGVDNKCLQLSSSSFNCLDVPAFQSLLDLIEKNFSLQKNSFRLSYFDEEQEKISVTCWNDFKVALDEHAAMKKTLQIYVEHGDDADPDEEDLVVINNSPSVISKQDNAPAQGSAEDAAVAPAQENAFKVVSVSLKDENGPDAAGDIRVNPGVSSAAAVNTSFWWRLFGNASAAANAQQNVSMSEAAVEAEASAREAASPAVSPAPVVDISPTLSMLLLSDVTELLNHLRTQTVCELDSLSAANLSSALHSKVPFNRTKQVFEEELRAALSAIRKSDKSEPVSVDESKASANAVLIPPVLKKDEIVEDALAAIEEEEKKDAVKESTKASETASYAAVVSASMSASSSSSAASPSSAVPPSSSARAASGGRAESKSAAWSAPAAFSMSDESVAQVLDMCSRMGFKADAAKIRFLMDKSKGDYDTLIDWLITDSVVKITVPPK